MNGIPVRPALASASGNALALALVPPDGPGAIPPETVLLGLPIVRRTVLCAQRAGYARIFVPGATPAMRAALEGTRAELDAPVPADAVRLPWNRIVSVRDLAGRPGEVDGLGVALESPSDLPRAERHLLRSLIKDTEGFMSRHFDRRISLAISRRLAGTRVTPNMMTILSVAIGVFGALFFLSANPLWQTAGALCFVLHSIVDGCDGELARLRFQESRWGGLLDFWGDNVVHVAVYSAIAVGWSRAIGQLWPLWFGALAILGNLASASFVHLQTMRSARAARKDGPLFTSVSQRSTRLSRVADELSRRDFIYLVLILSAFGKAHWFLVMAAVGAPIYFLVLVGLALSERRGFAGSPSMSESPQ
jgi:1L-myo-inositol 1-phosphate cytidylyltransferase / CDP-L-myo-inositol myo-inositolphosphotransferase